MLINKKGFIRGIPVWYHPKGAANIILLKTLKSLHIVIYDSLEEDKVFKVHTPDEIVKFQSHKNGLHYLELNKEENSGIPLVTTVQKNYKGYTKKEIEGAIKVQEMQAMLGHPSKWVFEDMVHAT